MAALVLDLSSSLTSHLKSFLTVIEREIERDESTINLPLKTLAQDVFDVFKRHCDIHLITSNYADIAKQTKRLSLGKKQRMKVIENAKKNRRKTIMNKTSKNIDEF